MTSNKNIRLCLHVDVNKTIIMSDVGSGRSIRETLNSLLSECTWGFAPKEKIANKSGLIDDWVVCSDQVSTEAPLEGAMTFGTYLEDYTSDEVTIPQVRKVKRAFTENGAVGERFKNHCDQLESAMKLDEVTSYKAAELKLSYLAEGYMHIMPSFFRLVEYLAENDIEFNILFRTFGLDIENVCDEFNLFCTGNHPLYVPSRLLDGSDPSYKKDLRIRLPNFHGKLSHTGGDAQDLHMQYLDASEVRKHCSCACLKFKEAL
jgi:hypothetical protein